MRLARLVEEASVELAVVESVIDSARKIVDTAVEAERVASRITAHVKTAGVIIAGGVVILGLAYGTWSLLEHRRAAPPEGDATPEDGTSVENNG